MDADTKTGRARSTWILASLGAALAALLWAAGFVAALHGVRVGLSPADVAFHRLVWPGFVFFPFVLRQGVNLGGIGWGRGLVIGVSGGVVVVLASYFGFLLTPLGHGAVIQPSFATLSGLLLGSLVLHEHLSRLRMIGAITIVAGLALLGAEAVLTIGRQGVIGDLLFVMAGVSWGVFTTLLRRWGIDSLRALMIICVVALLFFAPVHGLVFGYEHMRAAGLGENLLQIIVQGVFAGPLATYLFARAVGVIGAGRASAFAALVPVFTVLIGFLTLGVVPTAIQLLGLVTVLVGFRFVMKV